MPPRQSIRVALAALLVGCAAPPSPPAQLAEADKNAIRSNLDAYTKHALAGKWDAWGMTLAPDVVYMPPNMTPLMGRDAAVTFGRGFPKLVSLTIEATDIDGRSDMAYARGRFAYAVTMSDGTAASDSGSFVDVYRKQPDGAWLAAQVIWHSNAPLPAPPTPGKK